MVGATDLARLCLSEADPRQPWRRIAARACLSLPARVLEVAQLILLAAYVLAVYVLAVYVLAVYVVGSR